ncbi:MAG: hypothetical protein GY940_40105 [bacterium]|nr:hypothetical protein [bacterium]
MKKLATLLAGIGLFLACSGVVWPSRFIVLDFRISQYNAQVRNGIDFVLDNLVEEGDRLVVSSGGRTLCFDALPGKSKIIDLIETVLTEQSALNLRRMHGELKGIEAFIDEVRKQAKEDVHPDATYGDYKAVHPHYYMKYLKNSIERYLSLLLGYKRQFLLPDVSGAVSLSGQVRPDAVERRFIWFWQMPVLPRFSRRNRQMIDEWIAQLSQRGWLDELDYTRKLQRLQGNIDNVFEVSSEESRAVFRELAQRLERSGFVFHAVLLPAAMELHNKELKNKFQVSAAVQNAVKDRLTEVSRLTGGSVNDIDGFAAMDSPLLKPTGGSNAPAVAPIQPRNVESTYTGGGGIKIKEMTFKNKRLSLGVTDFAIVTGTGKLSVRVRIIDKGDRVVFDKEKTMIAQKESVSLSLDFKRLEKGTYYFITDAKDLITGKTWARVAAFRVK